jgi:hypothetical protein
LIFCRLYFSIIIAGIWNCAINERKAPDWAYKIQIEILTALKNIGDGSIHTNDGDITKQDVIDNELIETVNVVLSELLAIIYEEPFQKAERLKQLKIAATKFK